MIFSVNEIDKLYEYLVLHDIEVEKKGTGLCLKNERFFIDVNEEENVYEIWIKGNMFCGLSMRPEIHDKFISFKLWVDDLVVGIVNVTKAKDSFVF